MADRRKVERGRYGRLLLPSRELTFGDVVSAIVLVALALCAVGVLALVLASCADHVDDVDDVDAGPSAVDAGACSCDSSLDLVHVRVSGCVPQSDGSCLDAGVNAGDLSLRDFVDGLCPEPAELTCADGVYTDSCRGLITRFPLVASDGGGCHVEPE